MAARKAIQDKAHEALTDMEVSALLNGEATVGALVCRKEGDKLVWYFDAGMRPGHMQPDLQPYSAKQAFDILVDSFS